MSPKKCANEPRGRADGGGGGMLECFNMHTPVSLSQVIDVQMAGCSVTTTTTSKRLDALTGKKYVRSGI